MILHRDKQCAEHHGGMWYDPALWKLVIVPIRSTA